MDREKPDTPGRVFRTGRVFRKKVFPIPLLAAVAGAWLFFHGPQTAVSGGGEFPLAMAVVEKGRIEDVVTAQGALEPKSYVDVGVQVSGQLRAVHVAIGDDVKAGDLIAEIDPKTYEARVAAGEATVKELAARVAEQEAVLEKNTRDFGRNREMRKVKAVSEQALQDSETAVLTAQAQLDGLKAQLEGAQSTLDGDRANLGYTKIYAPMSGTVLAQDPRQGQTLNASQTAPVVARIGDLNVLSVRAQVAEADVASLKTGMPVYFTTLRSPDLKWQGAVRLIQPSPQVVNQVVLYDVLVDVDNRDRRLMTGMSAQVFFVVATAEDVPLVPVAALGRRMQKEDGPAGEAYGVRVLDGKDAVEKTVHIGLMDRRMAEVRDGLAAGDTVVLPAPAANGGGGQARPGFMRGPRL